MQDTKLFNFQCEVTSGNDNPNQEIEVVWTFDGKEDPKIKPQIINSRSRKATLPGSALVGHLNSRVSFLWLIDFHLFNSLHFSPLSEIMKFLGLILGCI